MSFQSFGRISATLVFHVRLDKPAGKGVVLRPCAKSSITIPREAERKAFEQDARLKSVYKAHEPISEFEALQKSSSYVCGHLGAILGLDTPCTELCGPGFIDDGQCQARDTLGINDLLHRLHKVRCKDIRSGSPRFTCGRINRAVKSEDDREEEAG